MTPLRIHPDAADNVYDHTVRTYCALAKGNLWVFMDIYPWLWFFLEYGFDHDGTVKAERMNHCVKERDWNTLQAQSKCALEELPFGPHWFARLQARVPDDPVYPEAKRRDELKVPIDPEYAGPEYSARQAAAHTAHKYVRENVKSYDEGYRLPPSGYWNNFPEAFCVMQSERKELTRIATDNAAAARLVKIRDFKSTSAIEDTYKSFIAEASTTDDATKQNQQNNAVKFIFAQ
ncbi:MAG TPA: hypothetical protein VNO21_01675, partial [Polyangiaceae bacterium]|nr:hypothetical protein [Polyangiaceae bacterium]